MAERRPFFVLVPAASQNPAAYGYLCHLLLLRGYPVWSAPLPTVGAAGKVTVEDDVENVREKILIPILDHEERDVILIMHSYSGVPGSAAARGLSKSERLAEGKKTGIIGQIYIAALLAKGGDGKTLSDAIGGQFPPHLRPDPEANLVLCDDRIPPLFQDVPAALAEGAAASTMAQGLTSFNSPCPRATWDSDAYKGRVAFIRTVNDASLPLALQQMFLDGTGAEWIVKDIESGHSPQLSQPENLVSILIELAKQFESS